MNGGVARLAARLLALPILAVLAAGPVAAQGAAQGGASPAQTAQQDRMRSCNAEAGTKSLAGEARQRFMSECLSGATAAPAQPQLTAQQERMRSCNAEAGTRNLTGEPRQRFMNSCLSGAATTGTTAAAPAAAAQGAGRFSTEAQAKRGCGSDAVVWANSDSQVFHAAGSQFYGKTQQGEYMCKATAEKAGLRLAGGGRN